MDTLAPLRMQLEWGADEALARLRWIVAERALVVEAPVAQPVVRCTSGCAAARRSRWARPPPASTALAKHG